MGNFNFVEAINDYYKSGRYFKDRNLSILEFNMRVFDQINTDIPIIEKLNFIYITFSNIDEFISVRLPECKKSDRSWYIHTIENIYDEMNKRLEELIEDEKINLNPWDNNLITGNKKFIDGGVYYVYYIKDSWGLVPYTGNDKAILEKIRLLYPNDTIQYDFYIRLINDKSFRYYYFGETTEDVLNEIKTVVDIKNNAPFHMLQTTCQDKTVMDSFSKYIGISDNDYMYIDETLIKCQMLVKKIKKDNPDPSLYHPKFNANYVSRNYSVELLKKDILVYSPYDNYQMVLDFIDEMCNSKDINSIFISLYRVAENSKIIQSLLTATSLGKNVFVYIEPTARGNEKDNLLIIENLRSHGVIVACNYFNYKVHAKMFCAVDNRGRIYSHVGTGNYNEITAAIYTDYHLMTTNLNITNELLSIFKSLFRKGRYIPTNQYSPINSSPVNFRAKIIQLINDEIDKGSLGWISIKCNSLCDGEIINHLYTAAEAGVSINIICRTGCSITSHPNITVKSKVGRFLEHDRTYMFGEHVFISSADLLLRNISKRVEILCEITTPRIKTRIRYNFQKMWNSDEVYVLLDNGKWDISIDSILDKIDIYDHD